MIQLVFDAGSAEEALETEPVEVGYSQHEGAERAEWGDEKLEIVDGTHPVVYPAAGSHANFYSEGLFLGRSAEQGVGCDDTTGPSGELRPAARLDPERPGGGASGLSLDRLRGPLGRAPAGVLQRPDRAEPEDAVDGADHLGRRTGATCSYAVPAGGSFGTDATDFFCGAVAAGSNFVLRAVDNGARVAFVLVAPRRAGRLPADPDHLAAVDAAPRRPPPFLGADLHGLVASCTSSGPGSSSGSGWW